MTSPSTTSPPMNSPMLALRAAILARCAGDAALASLMGGAVRLHDEPPRDAAPLYALFGDAVARDWSDTGGRGHEHELAILVWARPGSAASALAVAGRIGALLDDAALAPDGHRLVQIALRETTTRRDRGTNLVRVTLALRATTEVAA